MNTTTPHQAPHGSAIVREQFRTVGLAIRREIIAAALLIAGLTLLFIAAKLHAAAEYGEISRFTVDPSNLALPLTFAGVVAALAVWKGEEPSRRAYFWSMPVDRARHTLIKVFTGWCWFMIVIAGCLAWALVMALLTGGEIGVRMPQPVSAAVAAETGAEYAFQWVAAPPWMWLLPFTAPTITYLLGTVATLRSNHPWRWLVGIPFVLFPLLGLLAELGYDESIHAIVEGAYGLETALTGLSEQGVVTALAEGRLEEVGLDILIASDWAVATLLWLLPGIAGILIATFRHQEA